MFVFISAAVALVVQFLSSSNFELKLAANPATAISLCSPSNWKASNKSFWNPVGAPTVTVSPSISSVAKILLPRSSVFTTSSPSTSSYWYLGGFPNKALVSSIFSFTTPVKASSNAAKLAYSPSIPSTASLASPAAVSAALAALRASAPKAYSPVAGCAGTTTPSTIVSGTYGVPTLVCRLNTAPSYRFFNSVYCVSSVPYSASMSSIAVAMSSMANNPVLSSSEPSKVFSSAIATSCSTPARVKSPKSPEPVSSLGSPVTGSIVTAIPILLSRYSTKLVSSTVPIPIAVFRSSISLNTPSAGSLFGSPITVLTAFSDKVVTSLLLIIEVTTAAASSFLLPSFLK